MKLIKWASTLGVVAGVGATITMLPVATTSCSIAGGVRQVFMALDSNGDRPRDTFYPDTQNIYCDVIFSGGPADTTVQVEIVQTKAEASLGTASLVPSSAILAAGEVVPGEGVQTIGFGVQPPQADAGAQLPFPVGEFECRVLVNGALSGKTTFHIDYPGCDNNGTPNPAFGPECPAEGAATPGAPCAGLVRNGAQCPNAANTTGSTCTCNYPSDPLWSCQ
jgi:hypothetical protein